MQYLLLGLSISLVSVLFFQTEGCILPFPNPSLDEKKKKKLLPYLGFFCFILITTNPCPLCKSISLGCSLCTLIPSNCKLSGMSLLIKEDSLPTREGQHRNKLCTPLHFSQWEKKGKSISEVWKASSMFLLDFLKIGLPRGKS